MNNEAIARAFSGHRFEETFDYLSPNVTWILVGQARLEGPAAVIDTCRQTTAESADVGTTWLRFISAGTGDVVAVDAIGRYEGSDGISAVSSCDIFEFSGGKITTITSYAVEVDPDNPSAAAPGSQ
jgi:ketosteroid isomerase-like protein